MWSGSLESFEGERRMVVEVLFDRLVQHLIERTAVGASAPPATTRRGVAERETLLLGPPHAGFATIR